MFKVVSAENFWWPVSVQVPVDGKKDKQVFTACFKVMLPEQIKEIIELNGALADLEMMKEALIDWKDVAGESGEFSFNDENKQKLLGIPYVRGALFEAYLEAVNGKAKAKN